MVLARVPKRQTGTTKERKGAASFPFYPTHRSLTPNHTPQQALSQRISRRFSTTSSNPTGSGGGGTQPPQPTDPSNIEFSDDWKTMVVRRIYASPFPSYVCVTGRPFTYLPLPPPKKNGRNAQKSHKKQGIEQKKKAHKCKESIEMHQKGQKKQGNV